MSHTSVLIVGAGPTGLVLAAILARTGVEFHIVDKHARPLELTKAAALHARTLEYFRDLGVVDRMLAEGQRVDILALRTRYRDRLAVDFRVLADTAYPHMLDIPQYRVEHILIDHLADVGVQVNREVTLTGLTQTPDGVLAQLQTADGGTEAMTADWVVGCDGVKSTVRSLIGLDFAGSDYADDWVLCDAVVDWPLPRNEMTFSADGDGIYGVFPLPGESRYRLAYTQRKTPDGRLVDPDLADAQAAMTRTGIRGTVTAVDQFWTFNLSHRQAASYRRGRVFLVGDAGHVHTPFGGQGLNLGVGDAANLGWKLASVVRGGGPTALLDSYQAERHAVASQVVAFTHRGARAMLLRNDPRSYLRDTVLGVLQAAPPLRHLLARRFSQLAQAYRGSPVVMGRTRHLRAGDRLPDRAVFDGVTDRIVRLHELLQPGHHTLLLAGTEPRALLHAARALTQSWSSRWSEEITVRLLTTSWNLPAEFSEDARVVLDRGRDAAPLYGRSTTAYLVRPDGHIGYAGTPDPDRIGTYLRMVLTTDASAATKTDEESVRP